MFPARARRWSQTPVTASSRWALVGPSSAFALQKCECAGDLAKVAGLILLADSSELRLAENDLPPSYRCSVVSAIASIVDSHAHQSLSLGCLPTRPCADELSVQLMLGIELE